MAKATKLSSGNWRCKAYYTDENGKYTSHSFTAETKKEAEYKAAEFLMDRKHKKKPENNTVGELIDKYLDSRSHILSPSTMVGYRKIRRTAFQELMNTRAGFVTQQMVQSAVNEYAKGRSPKTVLEAYRLLTRVFSAADIVIDDKAIILPQKVKNEIKIPTTEEVKLILEASHDKGIYLPVILAAMLGLRKSEIFALTWEDIDINNARLRINKATVKDEYGEYVLKTTKTEKSTRTLYLPTQVLKALSEHSRNEKLINISPDVFDSRYKRLIVKLGMNYNFHALRHYCASIMLINGIPNKYAMERMGHSTDNMLKQVYQHTYEQTHKQFDKDIENYFNKNGI